MSDDQVFLGVEGEPGGKLRPGKPYFVIFDADGTLRRCTIPGQPCPNRAGEWVLLPGVKAKIASLAEQGACFAIASNQGGIASGKLSALTARALLNDLVGAAFPPLVSVSVYLCPHDARARCSCRKPAPGMLLEALGSAGVAARDALFVGDMASDQEAARRAGVPFAWAADFFGFPVERPEPSPRAPDLEQHRAILADLLKIECARLAEARALEQKRGFIFPETTVIARDVARLSAAVHLGTGEGQGGGAGAGGREDTGGADRPDDPEPIPDTDRAGGGGDPDAAALRSLGVGGL